MKPEEFKILIVDDEPDIIEIIEYNLRKEGFQVEKAKDGEEAIKTASEKIPDLILLDIMMPELDGIEVCRELRNNKAFDHTVIAFLTARNEDFTQIAGFDVGGDDYITKPIKPRLLISRIKALLRRKNQFQANDHGVKKVGDLIIDREQYSLVRNGLQIELAKKEFELLDLLASKPGKVFTRQEIFNRVWGYDVIVGDRTIDVHVRKLREKIGAELIKTVKGIGYKLFVK